MNEFILALILCSIIFLAIYLKKISDKNRDKMIVEIEEEIEEITPEPEVKKGRPKKKK
jgi:uncharacterized ion transporter superfamily protein YfcC